MIEAARQTGSAITVAITLTDGDLSAAWSETYDRVALADVVASSQSAIACATPLDNHSLVDLEPRTYLLVESAAVIRADALGVALQKCCCPCRPLLIWRGTDLDGEIPEVGEIDNTPDPPTPVYGCVTEFVLTAVQCRPPVRHPDSTLLTDPEEATAEVTMEVEGSTEDDIDAQQTIIFTGGDYLSGTATLQWIPPEGDPIEWILTTASQYADNGQPRPGHGFDGIGFGAIGPADVFRITRVTGGVRIGFIGKWGSQPVNLITVESHDIVARSAATPTPGTVSVTFALFTRTEEDVYEPLTTRIGVYDIEGACPDGFPGTYEGATYSIAVTW